MWSRCWRDAGTQKVIQSFWDRGSFAWIGKHQLSDFRPDGILFEALGHQYGQARTMGPRHSHMAGPDALQRDEGRVFRRSVFSAKHRGALTSVVDRENCVLGSVPRLASLSGLIQTASLCNSCSRWTRSSCCNGLKGSLEPPSAVPGEPTPRVLILVSGCGLSWATTLSSLWTALTSSCNCSRSAP